MLVKKAYDINENDNTRLSLTKVKPSSRYLQTAQLLYTYVFYLWKEDTIYGKHPVVEKGKIANYLFFIFLLLCTGVS